ncbi:MAG TPA: CmpA/NrtA family ABC transporter substrate-binding protein [Xanthobacteraceae bacterium]|jgi:NitT/TauT family transport system ATP-binding protein
MSKDRLRIGFIPLADAAALIVAVDRGFAAKEGLAVDLVREVSWSNVRDKLNIGLFDAAHLLAPVAIASSLGIGHVKVPLFVPFMLGLNGNAITVSPALHCALAACADGDLCDPKVSARALAGVVAERRHAGAEPLTFGMTFPFSTHNYQLRLWMAAGGIDPEDDVRLVVLPPPYMVESLANHHVDGFCVGAPWNSVAVDLGIGRVIHFGCDIVARAPEKALAVRAAWIAEHGDELKRLLRALGRAATFINDPSHRAEAAALIAAPNRIGVAPELVRSTLEGRLRIAPDRGPRTAPDYLLIGRDGAARPDPIHAAWLYAQMVRWRQTPHAGELLTAAEACMRPDLYDAALGASDKAQALPPDGIGAFDGPPFDSNDLRSGAATGSSTR